MEAININLETIIIPQYVGPYGHQWKRNLPIKNKRKTINGKSYNTAKSKLIVYDNNYEHENNFTIVFIYQTVDNEYFKRTFSQMGETAIELVNKDLVLTYLNKNKSLF